jgi:hypothetical protein
MHAYRAPGSDAGGQRRRSSQMARCLGSAYQYVDFAGFRSIAFCPRRSPRTR